MRTQIKRKFRQQTKWGSCILSRKIVRGKDHLTPAKTYSRKKG